MKMETRRSPHGVKTSARSVISLQEGLDFLRQGVFIAKVFSPHLKGFRELQI